MFKLDCAPLVKIPGANGVTHFWARSPGFGGDAWCHLIPGTERALLVDTGFGIGNLKGLCEEVTNLPIDVINSHNHGDHVGGNPQFARTYIHEYDIEGLTKIMTAGPREITPPGEVFFFEQSDVIQPKESEILPLQDGDIIDLGGGYELEIFHLPGHAAGGIAILDKKRRMLFTGDALVFTPIYLFGALRSTPKVPPEWYTVEAYLKGLQRLNDHIGEFDAFYAGHSQLGLSPSYVPEMIKCCEELLAGDLTVNERLATGRNVDDPLKVHVYGKAKIAFSPERIRV